MGPASTSIPKTYRWIAFGLFYIAAGLYLHTMGPSLVPYRDAGEIATTVTRLGVLHPPGYPLYTLVGKLVTKIPLANPAYRLNLLSALSLAAVWSVLFILMYELWGTAVSLAVAGLGVVAYQFWLHALVSEMYTVNLLFLSVLLWLLANRKFEIAGFLFGLGLGVRMDLVLCAPALGILFFSQLRVDDRLRRFRTVLAFVLLGSSVYLYLLIRAHGQPNLNWGDPSTLDRFWGSVVRRSYAGTLDLLSKSYQTGENFLSEFRLYLRHLGRDFSLLSYPLVLLGMASLWQTNRRWFWTLLCGWSATGPLFIFLGNLPPNPHAVAIMEAAYLNPDIFYLLSIGAGLHALKPWRAFSGASLGLVAILVIAQGGRCYPFVSKRNNYVAVDFIHNVFYSVPEPSLIVGHSDVPIFSLFYGHWIYPGFKWRVPIAQGLSGSGWYQVMMDRQISKLDLEALGTDKDWEIVAKSNPGWSLFGTQDTNWTPELYSRMVSAGPLMQFLHRGKTSVTASDVRLSEFGIYRGRYRYNAYIDFFSPELIEEYANAWMQWGLLLVRSHQDLPAIDAFRHVLALKPDMPYAAFQLGFVYFQKGDWRLADYYYHWSVDNFRQMDRQALDWKSFSSIRESLRREHALALAHWGVVHERMGKPDEAVSLYDRALAVDPDCADARYNLAVIYWRIGRWEEVVENLRALSASHPEDTRWRIYLPKALEKLRRMDDGRSSR